MACSVGERAGSLRDVGRVPGVSNRSTPEPRRTAQAALDCSGGLWIQTGHDPSYVRIFSRVRNSRRRMVARPPRRGRKGPFSTRMDVLTSPEVGVAIIPRCVVNDYGRSESQHHLTPHGASPHGQWPSRPQFRRRANRMWPEDSARTVRRCRSNAPDATPCLR